MSYYVLVDGGRRTRKGTFTDYMVYLWPKIVDFMKPGYAPVKFLKQFGSTPPDRHAAQVLARQEARQRGLELIDNTK